MSRELAGGVHGVSRVVDPGAFRWTDAGWRGLAMADLILYELHVGTFTPEGTFDAVIARLPYLLDLGVTALEIMPVAEFPGRRNWGYDGVSLYAPHSGYGGPEGLRRLVDAAHRAGLAVLLDVVYNHLGPEGTTSASSAPTSPTATAPPGARDSTSTGPTATRSAATWWTTRCTGSTSSTSTASGSTRPTGSST